jgi:hypothetical protein
MFAQNNNLFKSFFKNGSKKSNKCVLSHPLYTVADLWQIFFEIAVTQFSLIYRLHKHVNNISKKTVLNIGLDNHNPSLFYSSQTPFKI